MDFNEIFKFKYETALDYEGLVGEGKTPTVTFKFDTKESAGKQWYLDVTIEKDGIEYTRRYWDVFEKVMRGDINPTNDVQCFKSNVLRSLLSNFNNK